MTSVSIAIVITNNSKWWSCIASNIFIQFYYSIKLFFIVYLQMAALGAHTETKKVDKRRVSCETLCSSNSSCVLQKRKPLHPLARSVQTRTSNSVAQRVLSAKFLRFKTLQNQLNDANFHIAQLVNENKILKNLQKRQDNALSKYEGASAQLPQVLGSHQEEIRVLQAKNKNLRSKIKDLTDQLKSKDDEVTSLRDQCKHLQSLCKNKNLDEREKLSEKVEELNSRLRESESTISLLNRKLLLETKNYKYKLNSEITKHKETQRELSRLYDQSQIKKPEGQKIPDSSRNQSSDRKSRSTLNLCDKRLEKLKSDKSHRSNSSNSMTNLSEDMNLHLVVQNENGGTEGDVYDIVDGQIVFAQNPDQCIDTASEIQLREIVNNLQAKNAKLDEKIRENMSSYSSEVMKNVRYSNDMVAKHTCEYEKSIKETELIMDTLKHADVKHDKLSSLKASGKKMNFHDYTILTNKTTTETLISQLLADEKNNVNHSFEEDLLNEKSNTKITEPEVDQTDKKKLLAKLKAIDNGDKVVENTPFVADMQQAKSDLMKELFG